LRPPSTGAVVVGAAVAAFVSVPLAAAAFAGLFALGGGVDVSFASLVTAMVGVHLLIGVGEALITGAIVSAVVSARPDLVLGAADLSPRPAPPDPLAPARPRARLS
jgi:cobalt/nickel transport system permease protein